MRYAASQVISLHTARLRVFRCTAPTWPFLVAAFVTIFSGRPGIAAAAGPSAMQACSASDLDLTVRFSNQPASTWTMAILARNASAHACTLNGHDVPAFVTADRAPAVPIQLCTHCDAPAGTPTPSESVSLEPGETAHETYRWNTQQAPGAPACQRARWLSTQSSFTHEHTLFFVAPALLPPICSQVNVEGFARGTILDEEDLPRDAAAPPPPHLRLTTPSNQLYAGELLTLRAESVGTRSDTIVRRGIPLCPAFLLRQRAPDGYTRYDEMRDPRIHCTVLMNSSSPQVHLITSFDSLGHLAALDPGDNTVQFLQMGDPTQSSRVALAESNRVTLRVIDPTTAPRRWGAPERGLRVDLTVDKSTFGLGEDIPLHIAAEVLSAANPLFGEPYLRRAESYDASAGSFHLAITSTSGPQPGADLPANLYRRMGPPEGPANCPDPLPLNSALPLERSLKLYDLLPNVPGTYQLVVQWTPYLSHASSCDHASPQDSEPYATAVSNPVVIRIAGVPSPVEEVDSLPEYTAWKSGFVLTDTPYGKHTGLLDQATHLEWLRLSATANKRQETLSRMMAPKRPLDGWRFATLEEVSTMFADFTGTIDGRSQDPAVERKLQDLFGGPLSTPKGAGPGWKRKISNGQIAGFEAPNDWNRSAAAPRFLYHYAEISETEQDGQVTATVNPHLTGWTDGDRTSPANGTFLVRRH